MKRRSVLRLAAAAAFAAAVVLSSPFIGQIRAAIRNTYPGQFRAIVGGATMAAAAAVLVVAIARIRARWSYLPLVGSLALAVAYGLLTTTGNADIDLVEHVHFIEYGAMALLFYRVWRPCEDASRLLVPGLAGLLVGTADEWFQWFVPERVGEVRDVALNGVAVICGLLLAVAIDPPSRAVLTLTSGGMRRVAVAAGLTMMVFVGFFWTVHLGYAIGDDTLGVFRSRYTAAELRAASADRTIRWTHDPPVIVRPLSREDQYLSEGMWHVQRRNRSWSEGDLRAAWAENQILERYFAPVLDASSYLAPSGARWPEAQRAEAARRAGSDPVTYVSDANPFPIYVLPCIPVLARSPC